MAISLGIRKGLAAKTASRARRQLRGRKKINGTAERPRMVVTRSARHLYVQVIDDTAGRTLVSASTMEADLRAAEGDKSAKAQVPRPDRRARRCGARGRSRILRTTRG